SLGQLALGLNCIAKALAPGPPRWNCWCTGRSRHPFYIPGRRPHRARKTRREGAQAQWRSVPVLAVPGAGHGIAEQLRLTHDSSRLVAATRRTLPLPFQYTRATGSHFPTHGGPGPNIPPSYCLKLRNSGQNYPPAWPTTVRGERVTMLSEFSS